MKSLRRQGSFVFDEARRKFCSEPWKNSSSVRTDKAAAPARSSSGAREAAIKSFRINPREGEAFFQLGDYGNASASLRFCKAARNPRRDVRLGLSFKQAQIGGSLAFRDHKPLGGDDLIEAGAYTCNPVRLYEICAIASRDAEIRREPVSFNAFCERRGL